MVTEAEIGDSPTPVAPRCRPGDRLSLRTGFLFPPTHLCLVFPAGLAGLIGLRSAFFHVQQAEWGIVATHATDGPSAPQSFEPPRMALVDHSWPMVRTSSRQYGLGGGRPEKDRPDIDRSDA